MPGLADILEQDWSEDSMGRPAQSEPTPPSLTPRSVPALRPARSAPPLMTPLTEETEGDLRSTSHAQGQSGTFGQLGTGSLSTAGQGEHPKPKKQWQTIYQTPHSLMPHDIHPMHVVGSRSDRDALHKTSAQGSRCAWAKIRLHRIFSSCLGLLWAADV